MTTDWASHFQNLSAQASRAARQAYAEQYQRTTDASHAARRAYEAQYRKSAFGASVGDVLSYRTLWNEYVMGTAKALLACADAWDAAAAAMRAGTSPLPAGPNYSRLSEAAQKVPESYDAIASSDRTYANDLLSSWNQHAGMSQSDMLLQASNILQDFQNTVLRTGQFYQAQVKQDCPNIPLPSPPSSNAQKQVISQLQGAGIAAQGALQLLGIGASGSLEGLGILATQAKDATVKTVTPWLPSKTTLIVGGIGGLVALLLVAKIVK